MTIDTIVNKHLTFGVRADRHAPLCTSRSQQAADTQYTYDNGWKYEFWLKSAERIVYVIHGGPMAGRKNFQTCAVQEVRADEIYQISWLEETGTVVSIIADLEKKRITTYMAFSKGHWDNPEEAHGDKRNQADFDRWRGLAKIGTQIDRHILPEQATLDEVYEGRGDIEDIDPEQPTI